MFCLPEMRKNFARSKALLQQLQPVRIRIHVVCSLPVAKIVLPIFYALFLCRFEEPPLLLVSMDGFRADYLQRGLTPHLQRLNDCGVHAPYMRATFPTRTFPNHYTIITVSVVLCVIIRS